MNWTDLSSFPAVMSVLRTSSAALDVNVSYPMSGITTLGSLMRGQLQCNHSSIRHTKKDLMVR